MNSTKAERTCSEGRNLKIVISAYVILEKITSNLELEQEIVIRIRELDGYSVYKRDIIY